MGDADVQPDASTSAGPSSADPAAADGATRATDAAVCPACGAPPSPGKWCMACGAEFAAAPTEGTLPPGGAVAAKKYACDGCGALMLYDVTSSGMKCGFCGGTKGIQKDDDYAPVEHALENVPDEQKRKDAPKVFHCDDCGATVTFEGATVSERCPFCGAEHVVERQGDADRILPAAVAPFAVDLERAKASWRTWLGKGWFRPGDLKASASEESLKGVYLPFWTYDSRTFSRWTAESGWHYTVTVSDGKGGTRSETRTRWQSTSGERTGVYDDVLVCASKGVDDGLLRKIEPFPSKALQPYRSDYLSGWLGEEYVIGLAEGWTRGRERINEMEIDACGRDVPGDTHRSLRVWTQHHDVKWKHVLLPIWIASYRYRAKSYRFLVNGVSGKVGGTAPVSVWRVLIAVAIVAAIGVGIWLLTRK